MQPPSGRNTGTGWSNKKKAPGGGKLVVDPRPGNKAPRIKPVVDPRPGNKTPGGNKPVVDPRPGAGRKVANPGLDMKIQPLKPRSSGGLFGVGGKMVNKVYKTY